MPQHWIVAIQLHRVVGGVFLPVAAAGALPMWFAGPTAYGDFLAGFSAPLVAWLAYRQVTGWRLAVLLWNLVGLADFVMAIGLGSQTLLVPWAQAMFGAEAISTGLVLELPLVLIPWVVVAIGISLHLLSLWKLATEGQPISSVEPAGEPSRTVA